MKILITGAAGLIGRILRKNLPEHELHLLDKKGIDGSIIADISNFKEIVQHFSGIDVVIHLAASTGINTEWDEVLKNNIIGTYNVFEASRKAGVKKIIYASSNHVTGGYELVDPPLYEQNEKKQIMITHETPMRPDGLYAVSKCFGELLGKYYSEKYGISVICLRIGTVLKDDKPKNKRYLATWLSHRDLVQLVKKCIEGDVKYDIFYGVSNNKRRFWDISHARKILGYDPIDDAEVFFHHF